jgi:hypothetical protein
VVSSSESHRPYERHSSRLVPKDEPFLAESKCPGSLGVSIRATSLVDGNMNHVGLTDLNVRIEMQFTRKQTALSPLNQNASTDVNGPYSVGAFLPNRVEIMQDRRRQEIEEKKAKLAELRKARENRKKDGVSRRDSEVRRFRTLRNTSSNLRNLSIADSFSKCF